MPCLCLDVVVAPSKRRACAAVAVAADLGVAPATTSWPPDPCFANARFLEEAGDAIVALLGSPPEQLFYRLFDPFEERFDAVILDLLEWQVAALALQQREVQTVAVSDRVGLRGAGSRTPLLFDRADVARVVQPYRNMARTLGSPVPGMPSTEVAIYGVPKTAPIHALTRNITAWLLEDGEEVLRAQFPWAMPAPDAVDLAALRRLVSLVEANEIHSYGAAAIKVWFDRKSALARETGSGWATRALDRAWSTVPDPACAARDVAALRRTLGEIRGMLEARGGDYDAAEEIFRRATAPRGETSKSWIELVLGHNPHAVASALLERAAVANHRGDSQAATEALSHAVEVSSGERSLRTTVLRLECLTLWAVACQDSWPFSPPGEADLGRMREVERVLTNAVTSFRVLVDAVPPAASDARHLSADRLDLGSIGVEREPAVQDFTLGAALGTLGRTQAFLGDHDAAMRTLLEARSMFTSDLDRRLNAAFLAHAELDRGPATSADRLERILCLLVPAVQRSPNHAVQRIRSGDVGFRFLVDILLKALAFGIQITGADPHAWCEALTVHDTLHNLLAALPSHPAELLGRHAGELLLRHGLPGDAQRWFDLAVRAAEAGGPSLRRSAVFTRKLALEGKVETAGPRGCLTNPCYSQR
jgi:tetratricopeptide (TPR) repeat protein